MSYLLIPHLCYMDILENYSLRPLNTFRIEAKARYFSPFTSTDELDVLLDHRQRSGVDQTLIWGGGSNILLTRDFDGWVMKNECRGIDLVHEDRDHIYVKAGAGENWHYFVQYCTSRNWAGLENLSLIPGTVGAAPIQNIGAYGVELRDCFLDLEAYHLSEHRIYTLTNSDCRFGYRDSVFKKELKGQLAILNVTFQLKKKPVFHTSYGAITQELDKMGVSALSIQAISDAVVRIRQSKLPDPQVIGNAGSFFKNPEIESGQFDQLQQRFPGIVGYPTVDGRIKLAAGWLIEQCGWKGFRDGDAGCHEKQALVLVNYGNATGKEIFDLSESILRSVRERYGIELEREVNIL